MSFKNFGLSDAILKAIAGKGYTSPTPIQAQAIPHLISGADVLGTAETGTGKTAAFCIPILQALSRRSPNRGNIRALILTPTRELAVQVGDNLKAYGQHLPLRCAVIYGGVSQFHQERELKNGVDIIVSTPGRLLDLLDQRKLTLQHVEILVLDEADRMLDMGFVRDVKRIIKATPATRQNVLFSATMPQEVQELVNGLLVNPVRIAIDKKTSKASIMQSVYFVPRDKKKDLLRHVIHEKEMKNVIVFTRTKYGADKVARHLNKSGITAEAIHGDKSQNARQGALTRFRTNSTRVLVATDIAARGIDINDMPFVINFELPQSTETYTHRIGRTGRAGQTGFALSFCDTEERPQLNNINRVVATKLTVV